MPLAILSASILTTEGSYSYERISLSQARSLASGSIDSYVGHQATAQILTELLGRHIPMNRAQLSQQKGQKALVFKLSARPPEGKILSRAEIERIGYEFMLITRTE